MCVKGGEPEILGSNINDYQTPVPVEVEGVEVSRVILVSLQRV